MALKDLSKMNIYPSFVPAAIMPYLIITD